MPRKVLPMKRKKRDCWSIDTIDMEPKKESETTGQDTRLGKIKRFLYRNRKRLIIGAAVFYILFFLFGLCVTRFYSDENGKTHAYKLTFSDLKLQDDYRELKKKLTDIRDLLAEITVIDIHFAQERYTSYEAATLYTKVLNDRLDILLPKVSSMNLQEEQEPIREEITSLLSYDLALYLQNMAKGLSSNDSTTVKAALAYRERALQTYEILETDIREIAERLKMNDADYYKWELSEAVKEKDCTAVWGEKEEEE